MLALLLIAFWLWQIKWNVIVLSLGTGYDLLWCFLLFPISRVILRMSSILFRLTKSPRMGPKQPKGWWFVEDVFGIICLKYLDLIKFEFLNIKDWEGKVAICYVTHTIFDEVNLVSAFSFIHVKLTSLTYDSVVMLPVDWPLGINILLRGVFVLSLKNVFMMYFVLEINLYVLSV